LAGRAGTEQSWLEAGRQLTDQELARDGLRRPGPTEEPWSGSRLPPADQLTVEVLADPDLAAAWTGFLDLSNEPKASALPQSLWPGGPAGPPRLADPRPERPREPGADLVLDFQARTAALLARAALSGAARLAEAPLYASDPAGRPIELTDEADFEITPSSVRLPRRADRVWVLGFIRFPDLLPRAVPAPPGAWPDWPGQARAALHLARILAGRGYLALPSAGGLFPTAPLAALAGLGEVGRPGLLITPEYGPNLRLLTIVTDYPFQPDRPAAFGAADYCETCRRCLPECPARALAEGPRRPGLWPWPVDFRACLGHRQAGNEFCRKCLEACPLTREPLITPSAGQPRSAGALTKKPGLKPPGAQQDG
jgi:hypothetical protein